MKIINPDGNNKQLSVYIDKDFITESDIKMVNIRMEKNIYEKIKNYSQNNDMTIKSFVICSCLEKICDYEKDSKIFLLDSKNIYKLIFQINKIGVNINQIAKKINSGEIIGYNFEDFSKSFQDIRNDILNFKSTTRKVK